MISALHFFQTVVLVGGTVHTMVPGEVPGPLKVLVHNGRIVELVAPGEPLTAIRDEEGQLVKPEAVDVTGLHILPGLIDGMVNHDADHDPLYVASGVTLVRDQAGQLARVLTARTAAARNASVGPDLFVSGEIFDGAPPVTTAAVVITSVEEAADKVPRYLENDIDYCSFYQGLGTSRQGSAQEGGRAAVLAKVTEMAHIGGVQVWGPRLPGMTLHEVVEAGQDGLFYLDGCLPEGTLWNELSPGALESLCNGVPNKLPITPGMRLYSQRIQDPGPDPPELAVLGPHYAFRWVQELDLRRNLGWDAYVANGARIVALQRELLGRLAKQGQPLLPGSGAPNPWILPGIGLHDELADWEKAGIAREQILEQVTSGAAKLLGVDEQRGSLVAGKIADLIVVRGDPRENLDYLRSPEFVVLRGRLLRRNDLDQLVDALVERIGKVKAAAAAPIEIAPLELPEGKVLLQGTVDNSAHGQRISAERYAVVEAEDGSLTYIGRLVTPGTATYSETVLNTRQHVVENHLEDFEAKIRFGPANSYTLKGTRLGGNMHLRQLITKNGSTQVTRNTSVTQEISFLDLGSITSSLVLAKHQPPGRFFALYLENLDPAIGNWSMTPAEDFGYFAQTPQGAVSIKLDSRGAPQEIRRVQGTTIVETKPYETEVKEGPGLAPPVRKAGKQPR